MLELAVGRETNQKFKNLYGLLLQNVDRSNRRNIHSLEFTLETKISYKLSISSTGSSHWQSFHSRRRIESYLYIYRNSL